MLFRSGNVAGFAVTGNRVHDVNNIGIDVIGGERDVHPTAFPRDGIVSGNVVERARSNYGGGYAAGIYVDGGRRLRITGNTCTENDLGIEIASENRGFDAVAVAVTGNTIRDNEKAGLVFGGYDRQVGRTRSCVFSGNLIVGNDTLGVGYGQVWIQYARDNVVRDNVIVAAAGGRLVTADPGGPTNRLDSNQYSVPAGAAGNSAARPSFSAAERPV